MAFKAPPISKIKRIGLTAMLALLPLVEGYASYKKYEMPTPYSNLKQPTANPKPIQTPKPENAKKGFLIKAACFYSPFCMVREGEIIVRQDRNPLDTKELRIGQITQTGVKITYINEIGAFAPMTPCARLLRA
ncbi:MAG: hypothetical protein EPN86_04020 [Nanoarchaeota archaeon]|nr:MAG: hypothetical protein EPN86_04020 [Nanoarchaeota archaeon]